MAGQAYAVATRWRSEVSRFAPDRLAEFDELIADALNNPARRCRRPTSEPTALQSERGLAGRERLIAQQRGERDGGRPAPPGNMQLPLGQRGQPWSPPPNPR